MLLIRLTVPCQTTLQPVLFTAWTGCCAITISGCFICRSSESGGWKKIRLKKQCGADVRSEVRRWRMFSMFKKLLFLGVLLCVPAMTFGQRGQPFRMPADVPRRYVKSFIIPPEPVHEFVPNNPPPAQKPAPAPPLKSFTPSPSR